MDTDAGPSHHEPDEQAPPPPASHTVPLRGDGWPDWLGRRPMSNTDRDKIRQALA